MLTVVGSKLASAKETAIDVFLVHFLAFVEVATKTDAGDEKLALSMECVHS